MIRLSNIESEFRKHMKSINRLILNADYAQMNEDTYSLLAQLTDEFEQEFISILELTQYEEEE